MRNAFLGAVLVTLIGVFAPSAVPAADDESPAPTDSASTVPSAAAAPAASASDTASPPPPVDDTLASARAKEWLSRLQHGQLDRTQMTADLNAGLQAATVEALAKQLPLGAPQHIVLRTRKQVAGITTWVFRVSWPDQVLDYTFGIENVTGKISALYLRPDAPGVTSAPLVYGAYSQRELDAQYDTALPARREVAEYLDRFAAASEAARAAFPPRTIAYGSHRREVLDLFGAPQPGAPLLFWIHGGYWRRLSKDESSFLVPPLARAGVAVAIPSYPLAPEASLDEIVAAVLRAYAATIANAPRLDADPQRVFVGGHSVGAQLAGMVAASSDVRGVVGLSGLYDLEPVRLSNVNATIAMDAAQARRYSPLHRLPSAPGKLLLATGEYEQDEFHNQQSAYATAWRDAGGDAREMAAPGHDHFSIVLDLASDETQLARALREFVILTR